MDAQIDYLVHELENEFRKTVNAVVRERGVTLNRASDVVLLEFERPADMSAPVKKKRRELSKRAFDDFRAAQAR
jgi:hypothetical protein